MPSGSIISPLKLEYFTLVVLGSELFAALGFWGGHILDRAKSIRLERYDTDLFL
jgi:hypothetical protein